MSDMPQELREIRINPVVPTESVLVSTARGLRPRKAESQIAPEQRLYVAECPFCRGNEALTPPTITALPNIENWEIRVVENLFPVLKDNAQTRGLQFGLQQVIDGYGRHEVIIDHHNHGIRVDQMSVNHLVMLFSLYRDRMRTLYQSDARLKYVLIFKNFGPAAGASIAHTHSQIIAMPVVPENVMNELTHSYNYHQKLQQNLFCSLVDEALTFEATIYDRESGQIRRRINVGQYVIEKGKQFIAIKPFASRFEWEIQIFPLYHQPDFLTINSEQLQDFATVLQRSMKRLEKVIGNAQYNFFLHTLPHGNEYEKYHASYQWHLEICPRTSIPTGFELGSGLFVSTVSPEDAALRLRAVDPNADT